MAPLTAGLRENYGAGAGSSTGEPDEVGVRGVRATGVTARGQWGQVAVSGTADEARVGGARYQDNDNFSVDGAGVSGARVGGVTFDAGLGHVGRRDGRWEVSGPSLNVRGVDPGETVRGAAGVVRGAAGNLGDTLSGRGPTGVQGDLSADSLDVDEVQARRGDASLQAGGVHLGQARVTASADAGGPRVDSAGVGEFAVDRVEARDPQQRVEARGIRGQNLGLGPDGSVTAAGTLGAQEGHYYGPNREAHVNDVSLQGTASYRPSNGTLSAQGQGRVGEGFLLDGEREGHVRNGVVTLGPDGTGTVRADNLSLRQGDTTLHTSGASTTFSPDGDGINLSGTSLGGASLHQPGRTVSAEGISVGQVQGRNGPGGPAASFSDLGVANGSYQDDLGNRAGFHGLRVGAGSGGLSPDGRPYGGMNGLSVDGAGFQLGNGLSGSLQGLSLGSAGIDPEGRFRADGLGLASGQVGPARFQNVGVDSLTGGGGEPVRLNGIEVGSASAGPAWLRNGHLDELEYNDGVLQGRGARVGALGAGPISARDVRVNDFFYASNGDFGLHGLRAGQVGAGPLSAYGAGLDSLSRTSGRVAFSGPHLAGLGLFLPGGFELGL